MLIVSSLFAAVIPMTIYLLIIWKMDRYEPEPLKFVFAHFIWGGFGAIVFSIFGSSFAAWFIDTGFKISNSSFIMAVISAPIIEEIVKSIYLTKTYRDDRFDNITDGLVYGGAIGLGFGMTENFFYFITYGDSFNEWLAIVSLRTAFSAVMHCITTGLIGAFMGYIKFLPIKGKLKFILRGLVLAILIHSLWNFSLSFDSTYKLGFLFMFGMILLFISIFIFSLRAERKILEVQLTGELPENIIKNVSSNNRFKRGWIEESIRLQLIKNCTRLAFRKRQLQLLKNDESISKEIDMLREKIGLQLAEINSDK